MSGPVWLDNAQDHGIYHQDWCIEDNLAAGILFQLGVRDEVTPTGTH